MNNTNSQLQKVFDGLKHYNLIGELSLTDEVL